MKSTPGILPSSATGMTRGGAWRASPPSRLLKSRKLAFKAGEKKEALALKLHEYIDAAKAPPGSDENAGPPKARLEKTVSFDDGQPPAKKAKPPPLEVD